VKPGSQSVVLERISKSYDGVAAVDDVSLEIGGGELFSLLGP
jgi:ABC-type Fe3+/spermidine/putrescine transport system ATPase subunit